MNTTYELHGPGARCTTAASPDEALEKAAKLVHLPPAKLFVYRSQLEKGAQVNLQYGFTEVWITPKPLTSTSGA